MKVQGDSSQVQRPTEIRWAFLLIVACGLVYVPFLLNRDLYWDDWSFFWVYWVEGSARMLEYFTEVSHIGHWLPIALVYGIGGEYVGMLTRLLAVTCHVVNGLLLFRILLAIEWTEAIALWIALIFVFSPFYYERGLLAYFPSDLYLFFYLISIWWLHFRQRIAYMAALASFVFSLGHETFMFLEPLRVLYVHASQKDYYRIVRRCAPFWIIAVAFSVVRITLLKPYGHYEHYNQFHLEVYSIARSLATTILFYFRAMWLNISSAWDLVGWYGMVGVLLVTLLAAWVLTSRQESRILLERAGLNLTLRRIGFGLLLALLGAIPYLLIARAPHVNYFSCRFAVVSVPGVLICLASLIVFLPTRFLRIWTLLLVLTISALGSLQITKWYLYESLVKRDLIMQLYDMAANVREKPMRLELRIVPKTSDVMLLRRTLSPYDLNTPLNMIRGESWPLVFVQDLRWFEEVALDRRPDQYCCITTFSFYPCPNPPVNVVYTLRPEKSSVSKMGFVELVRAARVTFVTPPRLGVLTATDGLPLATEKRSCPAGDSSLRPGGTAALSILGIGSQFLWH